VIIGTAAVTLRIGLRARVAVIVTMLPPVFSAKSVLVQQTINRKQDWIPKFLGDTHRFWVHLGNRIRGRNCFVCFLLWDYPRDELSLCRGFGTDSVLADRNAAMNNLPKN